MVSTISLIARLVENDEATARKPRLLSGFQVRSNKP
jgi:hypothetical protein